MGIHVTPARQEELEHSHPLLFVKVKASCMRPRLKHIKNGGLERHCKIPFNPHWKKTRPSGFVGLHACAATPEAETRCRVANCSQGAKRKPHATLTEGKHADRWSCGDRSGQLGRWTDRLHGHVSLVYGLQRGGEETQRVNTQSCSRKMWSGGQPEDATGRQQLLCGLKTVLRKWTPEQSPRVRLRGRGSRRVKPG